MASIMILDNQQYRLDLLTVYLQEAGYHVTGIGDPGMIDDLDASGIDLVIVNLYPDAMRTWDLYLAFKERYPRLPVLTYVRNNPYVLKSLKSIISSVLSNIRPSITVRGAGKRENTENGNDPKGITITRPH